jgi:hypothetical protein
MKGSCARTPEAEDAKERLAGLKEMLSRLALKLLEICNRKS